MLTVYIDFKSPGSYLALEPILSLVERNLVAIEWKPFLTHERAAPTVTDDASLAETHRRVRAASRRNIHEKYAAHQGIDLNFPQSAGDTDLALGALLMIEGDPLPFIKAAFAAYWTDHKDLNDLANVAPLLSKTSLEAHTIDEKALRDALTSAQAKAEEYGVVDAPALFIEDQLFIGREHLPWIEEIIRTA